MHRSGRREIASAARPLVLRVGSKFVSLCDAVLPPSTIAAYEADVYEACPSTLHFLQNCDDASGERITVRRKMTTDDWPLERTLRLVLSLAADQGPESALRLIAGAWERPARAVIAETDRCDAAILAFARSLLRRSPTHSGGVVGVLSELSGRNRLKTHDAVEMLRLACEHLGRPSTATPWYRLACVVEESEALGILQGAQTAGVLPTVRIAEAYRSADEYLDTYFRLLREDALCALRETFKGLRSEEPAAELNVFRARFVGVAARADPRLDSQLCLVFDVQPTAEPRRWRKLAQQHLMFGNLVALMVGRHCVEWAVVSGRLTGRESVQVWLVRYEPRRSLQELLEMFILGADTLLVASPTYFRAVEPVLVQLKAVDARRLPFESEVLRGEPRRDITPVPLWAPISGDAHALLVGGTPPADTASVARSLARAGAALEPSERVAATSDDESDGSDICWWDEDVDEGLVPKVLGEVARLCRSGLRRDEPLCVFACAGTSSACAVGEPLEIPGTAAIELDDFAIQQATHGGSVGVGEVSVRNTSSFDIVVCTWSTQVESMMLRPGEETSAVVPCWICTGHEKSYIVRSLRGSVSGALAGLREIADGSREGVLDPSQAEAAAMVLTRRLALIQGPPGTGKTMLGHALLEALLPARVLIVTYKNHCLDEFLLRVLRRHRHQAVRIGGRSDDTTLQSINLRALVAQRKRPEAWKECENSGELRTMLQQARDSLSSAKLLCETSAKRVDAARHFSPHIFLEEATDEQLGRFLGARDFRRLCALAKRLHVHGGVRQLLLGSVRPNRNARDTSLHEREVREFERRLLRWLPSPASAVWRVAHRRPQEAAAWSLSSGRGDDDGDADYTAVDEQERYAIGGSEELTEKEVRTLVSLSAETARSPWPRCMPDAKLATTPDLWKLDDAARLQAAGAMAGVAFRRAASKLAEAQELLEQSAAELAALEELLVQEVLRDKTVVAVTLTGASMYAQSIRAWRPQVVLVEEAAEVLESHLIASIGPSVRHVVQIGDHFQLPPKVETHTIQREHLFATSQMQRLISLGYPHVTLRRQGRMLDSMLPLLGSIYPDLQTNFAAIEKAELKPVPDLGSEVFWWDCKGEMTMGRSNTNPTEADRAVRLALFFISRGLHPRKVTLLAAYAAQAALMKRLLADELPPLLEAVGLFEPLRPVILAGHLDTCRVEVMNDGRPRCLDTAKVLAPPTALKDARGHPVAPGTYQAEQVEERGSRHTRLEPVGLPGALSVEVHTIDRFQGDSHMPAARHRALGKSAIRGKWRSRAAQSVFR